MANKKPVVAVGTSPNFTGLGELAAADRLDGIVNHSDFTNNSVMVKDNLGAVVPTNLATNSILGNIGAGIASLSAENIRTLIKNIYSLTTTGQILAYNNATNTLVSIAPGTNGQALIFDNTVTGGLKAGDVASQLNGLADVTINTPAAGQTIRHNGTLFVNAKLAVSDLSDVDLTGLDDGHVLQYDIGAGNWVAGPISVSSGLASNGDLTATEIDMYGGNNTAKPIIGLSRVAFQANMDIQSGTAWRILHFGTDLIVSRTQAGAAGDLVATYKQDRSLQLHAYANTRDDSATTPVNFLYTNDTGVVLSSPITELAIPAELDDLTDVDLTTTPPVDGQFLKYVVDKWVAAAAPTATWIGTATSTLNMSNNAINNCSSLAFQNHGAGAWSIVGNGANSLVFSFGASARISVLSTGDVVLGAYGSARPTDSGTYPVTNFMYTTTAGGFARAVIATMPYFRDAGNTTEHVEDIFFINGADAMKRLALADIPAFDDQTAATAGGATSGRLWKASSSNTMSVPPGTLIVTP